MSFTDEDLKRLKEDMKRIECKYDANYALGADGVMNLIRRLEAAEEVCNTITEEERRISYLKWIKSCGDEI